MLGYKAILSCFKLENSLDKCFVSSIHGISYVIAIITGPNPQPPYGLGQSASVCTNRNPPTWTNLVILRLEGHENLTPESAEKNTKSQWKTYCRTKKTQVIIKSSICKQKSSIFCHSFEEVSSILRDPTLSFKPHLFRLRKLSTYRRTLMPWPGWRLH